MALAELATLEVDAVDSIISILESNADILALTKNQVIELTELPEIVPLESDFPLIQVSDPATNFVNENRSNLTEFPSVFIDVYCYNYVRSNKLGVTFRGQGNNQGLFKLVGAVISALHAKSVNGFYWIMLNNISKGVPIPIFDVTEEKEDADIVFLKTVSFELRKKITIV